MESQNQPETTTFTRTILNGVNTLTGIGMVSIPYALAQGGWISLVMLLLIALLCFYTGILLKKCMETNPNIRSYPDIGAHAFGEKGRIFISIFIYIELFLVAVEFLILEGDSLHKLFPNLCFQIFGKGIGGKKTFIMISALVVLPTTWINNFSVLAYISASGIFTSGVLLGAIIWVGAFDGVGFSARGTFCSYNGLLRTISVYAFCFSGHAVFPTLYSSMQNKSQFCKVLLICFILSTINYASMAMVGYLMYGEHLNSQITLNLPSRSVSSKIAIYITLTIPIAKYAIIVSPISTVLENTIAPRYRNIGIIRIAIRTLLVIATVIVALVVPFFGYVMAFIGAFLCSCASILFPCVCYLRINASSRKFGVELMTIMVVIGLGIFISVMGTFTSVKDIVNHAK